MKINTPEYFLCQLSSLGSKWLYHGLRGIRYQGCTGCLWERCFKRWDNELGLPSSCLSSQGRETHRVKLQHSGEIIEVDDVDMEKVCGSCDCHVTVNWHVIHAVLY